MLPGCCRRGIRGQVRKHSPARDPTARTVMVSSVFIGSRQWPLWASALDPARRLGSVCVCEVLPLWQLTPPGIGRGEESRVSSRQGYKGA